MNVGLDLMPDIVSGLNLLAGEKYETIPSANGIGVWNGEEVVPMDTEDYIIHVTAAEMPATYEKEALKAQAVAARRAITPYPWLARKSWKVLTRNTKETRSCTEARRFSPSVTERLRQHRTDACITYATLTSREAASTKVANLICKR